MYHCPFPTMWDNSPRHPTLLQTSYCMKKLNGRRVPISISSGLSRPSRRSSLFRKDLAKGSYQMICSVPTYITLSLFHIVKLKLNVTTPYTALPWDSSHICMLKDSLLQLVTPPCNVEVEDEDEDDDDGDKDDDDDDDRLMNSMQSAMASSSASEGKIAWLS